ncbi:MAG TPA: SulP family inorganic anion transporter [Pseudolabrys sp.]|nr:SulP family inorganic anion transporter [Pseudolabrys sp.]
MKPPQLHARLIDLFSGAICSTLSIAYSLSYAALIFAGPLEHQLSYGVAVTFLSAAVAGAVVALRSSLPFAIAGPDSSAVVIFAAMAASLVRHLVAQGRTELVGPVVIAMSLATAFTGLLLCVLGFTRAGRAIRFVPYPVIGGFLGATGWLMITGAIQVVTDQAPTYSNLAAFLSIPIAEKLAAALALAVLLHILLRRSKNPFILPGLLFATIAIAHLVVLTAGSSLAAAQASGWMFRPQPAADLALPWKAGMLSSFPWSFLPSLAGDIVAVMFVTVITLLLNTTGIEIATRKEANVERDLRSLGIANLMTAAVGGYVSCTSLSRSTLAHLAGATGRLSGLTVAAIYVALLIIGPGFLGYVPKYALSGVLFFLGAGLVYQWLIQSSQRLLAVEYLSLIGIVLLIVYWGFIAGVLIGVMIGCATFALSASRVNVIKFNFDGSEYHSSLDRSPRELSLLGEYGTEIQGIALQSYLFFGSANRLYQHVRALLERQPRCRFLIFDFRLVTGIDSSATHSFLQIKETAIAGNAKIVLANLTPELEKAFRTVRFVSDDIIIAADLDRALESCEQAVIEAHLSPSDDIGSFRAWLSEALGSPQHAERLAEYCQRRDVQAGAIIARQGEAADAMHFILEGRIGIIVELGENRRMRVRSLGRHTTIGEMGLITHRLRSATIQAEAPSVLYELGVVSYERMKTDEPQLSQALLGYIVAVLAERLNFANRALGVLQR